MIPEATSPQRLMVKLALYFVVLMGSVLAIGAMNPALLALMPFGGTDAIEVVQIEIDEDELTIRSDGSPGAAEPELTPGQIGLIGVYLMFGLSGTILVMLPITWTYTATKREIGYRKSFVRALIVLPICATTIVLLIQDSLALAFGLAAMVAAVRFRVALQEAIAGIYIFSAICGGLAAGIGHLGVAIVMAAFFCFTNAVLWHMDYGRNPIDDAKRARESAKLDRPVV